MMKKIFLVIIAALLISYTFSFAFTVKGSGSAVISDDKNPVSIDNAAKNKALKNALAAYFSILAKESGQAAPDVTDEFLKFIKKFKILNRTVDGHTLTYVIQADIDDVALNDINYYIKQMTNSAVIANKGISPALEETAKLVESAEDILKKNSFTLTYNRNFQKNLPVMPTDEDIMEQFNQSNAQYLYIFDSEHAYSVLNGQYECNMKLITTIESKKGRLSKMQVTSEATDNTREKCVKKAYEAAVEKSVNYVRNNLLVIKENDMHKQTYTVSALNFGKFVKIKDFIDILTKRDVVTSHRVTEYTLNSVKLELDSFFTREDLITKIKELQEKQGFLCECGEDIITLNFDADTGGN